MSNSLSQVAGFVKDAFAIRPSVPFTPEKVTLGVYTFLPWVRTGLAAALTPAADGRVRATVSVDVTVQDDRGGAEPVSKTLTLRGPGDVIGLDATQIIKRVPAPGTADAEESFLAHVEFDRPELPWLFTPLAPVDDKLQPWLALVVCDTRVSQLMPGNPGLPPVLSTTLGELPSLADAWAWAHAQVVGPATPDAGATVGDRLTDDHAPANLSRVLCPRKLDSNRSYIACLVPTFDCGVRAGFGLGGGTLDPAWRRAPDLSDAATPILLPVYDSWAFSVAKAGDFEQLAERLVGVPAPWNVGRRLLDTSHPRGTLAPLPEGAQGRVQVLRCALVSPAPVPADAPPEGVSWDAERRNALREVVERANTPGDDDLPRVGPRLYARFQRAQPAIGPVFGEPPASTAAADADWFPELNTAPVHRVVAGVGTRVVQHDQEPLMQAAWAQVGDVEHANALLVRIQFGRYVGEALHRAHLQKLGVGELAQVLRAVHAKIRKDGSALTVHGTVAASWTPPAATTAAFRRVTRARGRVARFAGLESRAALRTMIAAGDAFRDLRRPYVEPDGIRTLSQTAISALSPAVVARRLGVPEQAAYATLATRLSPLAESGTVADLALRPLASWTVSSGTVDLGGILAGRLSDAVKAALPERLEDEPARAEALGTLLVGVANSSVPEVSAHASSVVHQLEQLPFHERPWGTQTPASHLPGSVLSGPVIAGPIAHGRSRTSGAATRFAGTVTRPAVGVEITRPPTATAPVRPGATSPVVLQPPVIAQPPAVSRPPVSQPPVVSPPVAVPPPQIRFETAASRAVTDLVVATRAVQMMDAARALSQLAVGNGTLDLARTPARAPLVLERSALLRAVEPARTASAYARSRFERLPSRLPIDWFDNGRLDPIMAAPHFDRPMYEAIDTYDRDWLVPGLGTIAKPDFVTVLQTNPAFTEAFLVGLSDEMGRELLWRGYPTDQRGTYFRRFWDASQDELAQDLHRWSRTPLGSHLKNDTGAGGHLVLVIRGELVRRYPDAMVMALRAGGSNQGKPIFIDPVTDPSSVAGYLFHGHLPPDILLVGFRLTVSQVRAEPWWFVIAEHPTAPRFGLDLFDRGNPRAPGATLERNAIDWNDLADVNGRLDMDRFLTPRARTVSVKDELSTPAVVTWPGTAASVARTLLQNPLRAAFDAHVLIAPALP